MSPERVAELIKTDENDLFERKREWWDLESKVGKANFAKDVLAMANALTPGESGYILVGIEDQKVGGSVVGVAARPSQESLAQILSVYTNPVPRIRLEEVQFE